MRGGNRRGRAERGRRGEEGFSAAWLSGIHSVQETLEARPRSVKVLWVQHELNSSEIAGLIRRARASGVEVRFVSRREMDRVAPGRHQGVAAKIREGRGEDLENFVDSMSEEEKEVAVLVALDQIQDPQNLGAIARSAANLGALGIILCDRRAAPVTPAAIRASAGAIQKLKVFSVANLPNTLKDLKERGFWAYGADASGESCLTATLNVPLVLVLGSEGEGMRVPVQSMCDALISVPRAGQGVESLNVSCAASVLLYEISRRQRGA